MSIGEIEQEIENHYHQIVNNPSDINEHLPTLKEYAEKCDHITEMGVRSVVSTFAFVLAKPKKMISIDINHPSFFGGKDNLNKIIEYSKINQINFEFIQSDTLSIEIEKTDLLFIDTWHCYQQLKKELEIHSKNVTKYIILHDTTLFEFSDEDYYGDTSNSEKHGLWAAIEDFLLSNSNWVIEKKYINNNGLTILKNILE
jgi:hypothetical protein